MARFRLMQQRLLLPASLNYVRRLGSIDKFVAPARSGSLS
ncbi:protein of unknown function [Methylocella tundrae]|uniref:Uncharacterized protein n=1 Tax=Methylocella tundrae TaxID=227605 RepID=A0A4U8YZP7_METTU|nr:protein of unknown function [Methylocella tundrae]